MAFPDLTTYQARVGRVQRGDSFYMKEGGTFQFFDASSVTTEVTFDELRGMARSLNTITIVSDSAAAGRLSGAAVSEGIPGLSPAYGYHMITSTAAVGLSVGSLMIGTASKGDFLVIDNRANRHSALSIEMEFSTNIISCFTKDGSRVSSILFRYLGQSADTVVFPDGPYIRFQCVEDQKWSVVESNYAVAVQGE